MVQDTCLWGTNYWLLTIKVNNYQNTELKEWIAFHVRNDCVVTSIFGCAH